MIFIIVLFIVCVGGGWLLSQGVSALLFGKEKETYIDKSIHHHYHTTINKHEHNSVSIIDEATKKKIFELQENENNKTNI